MWRSPLLVVPLTFALSMATTAPSYAQTASARKAKHPDTRTASGQPDPIAVAAPDQQAQTIALAYISQHAADFDLIASDVADVSVMSDVVSEHSGVTHVYLRQHFNGIEVHGAEMNVNVTRTGEVFGAGTSFVTNLARAISGTAADLQRTEVEAFAAKHLGTPVKVAIAPALVYEPLESGEVALAWLVTVEEAGSGHVWTMTLDASTGELFEKNELTVHDVWSEPDWRDVGRLPASRVGAQAPVSHAFTAETATATTQSAAATIAAVPVPGVPGSGTYNVFAWPSADPNDGPRSIVVDPADAVSSPFGWHDTDGLPGAESTQTVGNNVEAYVDVLNDNIPVDADRATGVDGVFDFPIDFTQNPAGFQPAAITNLFYWTNFIHDVSYRYGFTERAGNFQSNNYGRFTPPVDIPAPPDSLRAEAQDGSGTDNANFTVAADNALFPRPRMQMFLWLPVGGYEVQVLTGPAAGNHAAARANFRPFLADSAVTQPTAEVRLASPVTGCTALVGFIPGSIAYVEAGGCTSIVKANNARNAGAVGIIINTALTDAAFALPANNPLPGTSAGVGIPVLGISATTAAILRPALPFTAKMAFLGVPAPLRDGDFDAGVILHEYTHGISNRLTGGRTNVSCLNNLEQMGEGWSDWLALVLTHDPNRPDPRSRAIAPYLRFTGSDGAGLRGTRYTPDMSINSTTYGMLPALSVPNGVGFAWGTMLWDMYWNLIDRYGFNPNVYDAWDTGGNNLAIQLVMDGMKTQPCRPGFVDARDAILNADRYLTSGANQCTLWRGFAKRGLGFSAAQGSSNNIVDGVEAFDMPPLCQPAIEVSPPALTAKQKQNTSSTQSLVIRNATAVGGLDLDWTITEAETDCSAPSDVPWLSVSAASGTTAPNTTSETIVTFNAARLRGGFYNAKLCIAGAGSVPKEVPVSFNVLYDFRGFDGEFAKSRVDLDGGDDVRVEFLLAGFQGLDIFASGFPASQRVDCTTGATLGELEPAVTRRGSSLTFDGEYRWRWQTSATWGRTCRDFFLGLNDGSTWKKRIRFQ